MDHGDARFAADAIDARLRSDGDALEELAARQVIRLMGIVQALRLRASAWAPAHAGAKVLEAIARHGRLALDLPADDDEKKVVDSLRKLAGEPPRAYPRNRNQRRKAARILLPRRERLAGTRALLTTH